jgi:thiamine biosynthesis lipoprotein
VVANLVPTKVAQTATGARYVRAPGADRAVIDEVVGWLHWVDETFSTYRDRCDISRLTRDAVDLDGCAPEVAEVLRRCAELTGETEGYFDCYAEGRLDPVGLCEGMGDRARE